MALWDILKNELIDIIEWLDDGRDTLVWRYPRYDNEIKHGAKLIVREGQAAAFVSEGRLADVFQPGTYTLTTQNLPILAKLKGWSYGFESPFKSEVYFVSTRTFTDRKWGTKNPIMLRDPEFGPVRLRAFGTFVVRVSDPATFLRQVVGTNARFTVDQIGDQLRDMVVSRFADVLGESKIPVLDLASNYDELGKFISTRIHDDFNPFGLEVVRLLVENISLPAEVEQALDKRTSMGIIGNLNAYTQYQTAQAIPDAAKAPGGLAAAGVGIGMGINMASQVTQAMGQQQQGGTVPPPLPASASFFVAVNGQQSGPHDTAVLNAMVQKGELRRDTLVWRQGMVNWSQAGQVQELAPLFASVPPPLPK